MTSGGYRKNAKRPFKYGEPTVNLVMRVPKSKKLKIKKIVNDELKKYEVSPKPTTKPLTPSKKSR